MYKPGDDCSLSVRVLASQSAPQLCSKNCTAGPVSILCIVWPNCNLVSVATLLWNPSVCIITNPLFLFSVNVLCRGHLYAEASCLQKAPCPHIPAVLLYYLLLLCPSTDTAVAPKVNSLSLLLPLQVAEFKGQQCQVRQETQSQMELTGCLGDFSKEKSPSCVKKPILKRL